MKVFKNELEVSIGESFTLSKIIQNKDGSPYVISSELTDPYWLITVSDTIYGQVDTYIYNKWLSLKNTLRFYITKPINLEDLGYTSWDAVLPAGYEGDETSGYADMAVFYLTIAGVTKYKYWKYDNIDEGDYSGHWEDYECKIITHFSSRITSEWQPKNYYYSITLISGIRNDGENFVSLIDVSYPILPPTKIIVRSVLRGGS